MESDVFCDAGFDIQLAEKPVHGMRALTTLQLDTLLYAIHREHNAEEHLDGCVLRKLAKDFAQVRHLHLEIDDTRWVASISWSLQHVSVSPPL